MTTLREAALRGDFDHGIGADRFKVVRGAFWWHVLIGDSPTEHGKFRSRASAEKMAADLLREFRNGAFVQHKAALVEQEQAEPVAWMDIDSDGQRLTVRQWSDGNRDEVPLYTAPPQRTPLTEEEIKALIDSVNGLGIGRHVMHKVARAIERAHGITGPEDRSR